MTHVAWITGARGFLGRGLARHLADGGAEVAGVGHGGWPVSEAAAAGVRRWINADIDGTSLDLLLEHRGEPDVIYHLAGGSAVGQSFINPLQDFERTVHTTARLLDWVRARCPRSRVVAVSSAAVYGAGHGTPIGEHAGCRPYSPYGHHKAIMEALCRSYGQNFGVRSTIVRVFSAYGAGLRKQLLWDLCTRLASTEGTLRLDGTGDEQRDWIDVRDVARLLASFATDAASAAVPVMNGGTGVGHSVREVVRLLLDAWQLERDVLFSGRTRPGDPAYLVADASRLRNAGFTPRVATAAGIREYVAWFRRIAAC